MAPEVIALPLPKPELARVQEAVASFLERDGQVAVGQQEYCSQCFLKKERLVQQHVEPCVRV
jgi:hypothetical protein